MSIYYHLDAQHSAVFDPNYNPVTRLTKVAATQPVAFYRKNETSGTTLTDVTGNHHGTYYNTPTFGQPGAIRQDSDTCVYYDGVSEYAEVGHSSSLANASAMSAFLWVRTTSTVLQFLLAKYDHGLVKRQWSIALNDGGTGGRLVVNVSSDGTLTNSTSKTYYIDVPSLVDGNWHFVGFTWNSGTLTIYVDGVAVTPTKSRDASFTQIYQTDAPLRIGSGSDSGAIFAPFNGYIDEVVIYDYALNATQVANLNALGVASIKTVKPDGTGDYVTATSWSTAAGSLSEASKDTWWAECYSGSLGVLLLSAGSHQATLGRRPRVYAASGHEAQKTVTPSGAYISVSGGNSDCISMDGLFWWNTTCWYSGIQITGLHLTSSNSSAANGAYCLDSNGGKKDIVVERCVLVLAGTPTYASAHISTWGLRENLTFRNNLFVFNQTAGSLPASAAIICYGTATTVHAIHNNTFVVANGAQAPTNIVDNDYSSSVVAQCINNIAIGASVCFNSLNSTGSSHNISSDASAPGASSQHNVVATDLFTDYVSGDYSLKATSPAVDAGTNILDYDIFGNERDTTSDIGAFEFIETDVTVSPVGVGFVLGASSPVVTVVTQPDMYEDASSYVTHAEGRQPIAVDQPPHSGNNYPFVAPSEDIQQLLGDFWLSYEDVACTYVLPLKIAWLGGFGVNVVSNPEDYTLVHDKDLVVTDATGIVVFDSTQADNFTQTPWGDRLLTLQWIGDTGVCRTTMHTAWSPEHTPRLYDNFIVPANGILDPRCYQQLPRRVRSIKVGLQTFTAEELQLLAGYNTRLSITEPTARDGSRRVMQLGIRAVPGDGLGRFPGCEEAEPVLRRFNGIGPDNGGNFKLAAVDCYRVQRPVAVSSLVPREVTPAAVGLTEEEAGAALQFFNDCGPCCSCDEFVSTYEALRKVHGKYLTLGGTAEQVRDQYAENKERWEQQRACRMASPLRLLVAQEYNCRVAVAGSHANMTACCITPLVLRFTFQLFVDGIESSEYDFDETCGETRRAGSDTNYDERPAVFSGAFPVRDVYFGFADVNAISRARLRLRSNGCENGQSLRVTLSVHTPDPVYDANNKECVQVDPSTVNVPADVLALWATSPPPYPVRAVLSKDMPLSPACGC